MYWFRSFDLLHLLGLAAVAGSVWFGGMLLARHAYQLEREERLLTGAGIGLASYVTLANLLGHVLPPAAAFWGAGLAVLLGGVFVGLRSPRSFVDRKDFRPWRQLLALALVALLATLIARGLGIFDDRKNLSIVSTMAAGDIPPRFYMNGIAYFRYHYGSQLFAAALMRLGGMFPWSALDLTKGLMAALGAGLAYLAGRRLTHSRIGGFAFALVALLASGSRYLLLAVPQGSVAPDLRPAGPAGFSGRQRRIAASRIAGPLGYRRWTADADRLCLRKRHLAALEPVDALTGDRHVTCHAGPVCAVGRPGAPLGRGAEPGRRAGSLGACLGDGFPAGRGWQCAGGLVPICEQSTAGLSHA